MKCHIGIAARAPQSEITGVTVLMKALCACNPPRVFAYKRGPVQSASLGRPWWHHRWSQTEYRTPQSWALTVRWFPGLDKRHYLKSNQHWNRVPLLLIHDGLPWHPNNNQERTLLHTAVPEWLRGLFHWIVLIARHTPFYIAKNRHSCPEFWVCLALSGVHRLYHLRLPWHTPTKGPWAHDDSTCCVYCGTGELKTPGLIGDRTWTKPVVGDSDPMFKPSQVKFH